MSSSENFFKQFDGELLKSAQQKLTQYAENQNDVNPIEKVKKILTSPPQSFRDLMERLTSIEIVSQDDKFDNIVEELY